jgi:hypothetical protein
VQGRLLQSSAAGAGRDLALEFVAASRRFGAAAKFVVGVLVVVVSASCSVERNSRRTAVMSPRRIVKVSQLVGRFPQTPLLHHDVDEQSWKFEKETTTC